MGYNQQECGLVFLQITLFPDGQPQFLFLHISSVSNSVFLVCFHILSPFLTPALHAILPLLLFTLSSSLCQPFISLSVYICSTLISLSVFQLISCLLSVFVCSSTFSLLLEHL